MESKVKNLDENCVTKEAFNTEAEGVQNLENLVNKISESIVTIKSESDTKLGRLPLLEKKMNKWIKIFEQSEQDKDFKGTEQMKKIHELQVNLEKLDKLVNKTAKALNSLETLPEALSTFRPSD